MPNLRDVVAYVAHLRLEYRQTREDRQKQIDLLCYKFVNFQHLLPDEIETDPEYNDG